MLQFILLTSKYHCIDVLNYACYNQPNTDRDVIMWPLQVSIVKYEYKEY